MIRPAVRSPLSSWIGASLVQDDGRTESCSGCERLPNGAALARDSALTTASVQMNWMNGWSASATFEGEFSNVTRSYAGKGVVRYNW